MNIFYINVIELNAKWGAEYFVNRGFIANGHQTFTLDYRKYRSFLAKKFLEMQEDFDVVFLQRGDHFPAELIEAVNRPRFFWASELVSRCRDHDALLKSGLFDHIFVHSKTCERTVIQMGWVKPGKVSTLINGFDPEVHHKIPGLKKDIDILHVGNISPRRRQILNSLGKSFKVEEHQVFGEAMVNSLNRAKIVLNIHTEDFLDTETRIFEALGCCSFVITERLSEENPFTSGEHLVETNSLEEMQDMLSYYLKNDEERERIAHMGNQEAMANHTYNARARYIAEVMGKYGVNIHKNSSPIDQLAVIRYWERILQLLQP